MSRRWRDNVYQCSGAVCALLWAQWWGPSRATALLGLALFAMALWTAYELGRRAVHRNAAPDVRCDLGRKDEASRVGNEREKGAAS